MKKKIIAIGLITTMIICNSMTVWAASAAKTDTNLGNGASANQDVTAAFIVTTSTSYSVDISWGSLAYVPNGTVSGEWQEEGYYKISNFPGWKAPGEGTDIITVTNKSNADVKATFSYTIDNIFKADYFTTTEGSNQAAFAFTAETDSASIFSDNALGLGWVAGTNTQTIGKVKVGVTAPIDKVLASKGTNITSEKLGTVTVTISSTS